MLELFGQERLDPFLEEYNNRVDRLKWDKWTLLKHDFAPKLREIDPCLYRNAKAITRS